MIEVALAQLRYGVSMLFGSALAERALEQIFRSVAETQNEFGSLGPDAAEFLAGPAMDDEMRRDLQMRRFRRMARRGATETPYYAAVFDTLGLDARKLSYDDIVRLPLTPKAAMRAEPEAFVRRGVATAFRTTTTGTTGTPTHTYFSAHEIATTVLLNAISMLQRRAILPDDVVQVCTSSRATLGNQCFTRAIEKIGAVWYQAGLVDPAIGVALLAAPHDLPGKKQRASFLNTYSSYLGMLVEAARDAGRGPEDFGLQTISVGSEVVTDGLRRRARAVFGDVHFDEGFGMTEIWPLGATRCEAGHLHWEAGQGLVEVIALDSLPDDGPWGGDGRPADASALSPAAPGELGVLVCTPFAPYREAMVTLRYNTDDIVTAVGAPLECSLKGVPATSDVHGKRRLSVRHAAGWTTTRDVLEALEGVDAVPLPARCGFWAEGGGVAVDVVAPEDAATRRAVGDALEARGVPVQSLHIVGSQAQLTRALPLRGDLRELTF